MERNGTLDYARLLAAFGIVLFHAGAPGARWGYAALPFFLMLLLVLSVPGATRRSFAEHARDRARRLLVPWLIWSALYGVLKLAEAALTEATLASEFQPWMLLTGPALHLWFLPFAFVVGLGVPLLPGLWRRIGPGPARLGLALAGLAALALAQTPGLPIPLAQWAYVLPAVFLGLALAGGGAWGRATILLGVLLVALAAGWTQGLAQIALAAAALILCLALPLPATPLSRRAGTAAMGIYLAHPLALSLLERGTDLAPHSLVTALLAGIVAMPLAGAVGWLLPRRARPAPGPQPPTGGAAPEARH